MMAHVSWFTHGSDTILGEVGSLNGLFETYTCQELELSTVYRKCDLTFLRPDQDEPDEAKLKNEDLYHYGCVLPNCTFWATNPTQSGLECGRL